MQRKPSGPIPLWHQFSGYQKIVQIGTSIHAVTLVGFLLHCVSVTLSMAGYLSPTSCEFIAVSHSVGFLL